MKDQPLREELKGNIKTGTIHTEEIITESPPSPIPITETEITKSGEPNIDRKVLPPTTTYEENVNTASQRRVNLIWEHTQAAIAIFVTLSTMVSGILVLIAEIFYDKENMQTPTVIALAFGTVVGFYFSRTNHTKVGGIGSKMDIGSPKER